VRTKHFYITAPPHKHTVKKYINWQTGKIAVSVTGRLKAHTLVLIHGFCEDYTIWDHLLPDLEHLRVVQVDLPGFGRSTPIVGEGAPSLDSYTEALQHVFSALKIKNAVLVGHSLGGYIALRFADQHPKLLAGVGLVNSHPFADTPERKEIRTKAIGLLQNGGKNPFVKQLITGLFSQAYYKDHHDTVNGLITKARRYQVEGIVYATQAMRDRPDQVSVMQNTALPVLMILGAHDHLVPPAVVDQFMHLPKIGKIAILPEVTHMAMFEDQAATSAHLSAFVDFCTDKHIKKG
jgi:pimeloyl-ACP methyl ester carboxylesterase